MTYTSVNQLTSPAHNIVDETTPPQQPKLSIDNLAEDYSSIPCFRLQPWEQHRTWRLQHSVLFLLFLYCMLVYNTVPVLIGPFFNDVRSCHLSIHCLNKWDYLSVLSVVLASNSLIKIHSTRKLGQEASTSFIQPNRFSQVHWWELTCPTEAYLNLTGNYRVICD